MSPYTVVVGMDYSDLSRLAFREALAIASGRVGGEVHVVHVETATQLVPDAGTGELRAPRADAGPGERDFWLALQRLHRFVASDVTEFEESRKALGSAPIARVACHVRTMAITQEIVQLASDLAADLVVIGSHGRSAIARFFMGSVAHAVVTLAPCPVLVVRPKHASLVPVIEPPCLDCVEARRASGGRELWCERHRAHHNRRHTVHQGDRSGEETNFPLVFAQS